MKLELRAGFCQPAWAPAANGPLRSSQVGSWRGVARRLRRPLTVCASGSLDGRESTSGEAIITAEKISKSYDGQRIQLDQVDAVVARGARIGLVGPNGSGKSTLLRILAGRDSADDGKVHRRKHLSVGVLDQQAEELIATDSTDSVRDAVFAAKTPLMNLLRRWEALSAENASVENSDSSWDRVTRDMDSMNAWAAEAYVTTVLERLGVGGSIMDRPVQSLSGGQRKRVALAAALVSRPEVIVLDEPTNQMDVAAITWLESLLRGSSMGLSSGEELSTVMLVTHDRFFLDRVCTEIWELDNGSLYRYVGNYQSYLEQKERRLLEESKATEVAKGRWKKELDWIRRQPKARGTKSKSRVEAFYELEKKAFGRAPPKEDIKLDLQASRMGNKVLRLDGASLRFGNKQILGNISYEFQRGERIGIVGPSGVGKSTFLDVLMGQQFLDEGTVEVGETVVFGLYEQSASVVLPEGKRVSEYVADVISRTGSTLTPINLLKQFGFSKDQMYTFVNRLSGGERRRLQMLSLLAQNPAPNFLILDEPSNDLDLSSLEVLEDFLLDYDGCLVLVSHDRFFTDRVTDHLLVFEGEGRVRKFNGSFSEYLEYDKENDLNVMTGIAPSPKETKALAKEKKPPGAPLKKKKLSYKAQREFDGLEAEIEQLGQEIEELTAKLSDPPANCGYTALAQWTEKLAQLEKDVDDKTGRWMELADQV